MVEYKDVNWSVAFDISVNGEDIKFWELPEDVQRKILDDIFGDSYSGTFLYTGTEEFLDESFSDKYSDSDIRNKVAKYFDYVIDDEALDTISDIVDRVLLIKEENPNKDINEAIFEGIDEGLIYTKDILAIKRFYEPAELSDDTLDSLTGDVSAIIKEFE